MIDFDVVLSKIGGMGRYQILLILMVSYSSLPVGYNTIAPVFMNYTPDYRCKISNTNCTIGLSEEDILNITTPQKEDGTYDYCSRFQYKNASTTSNDCFNYSTPKIKCDDGYEYDRSTFTQTVITEFNLVCEDAWLDFLATSIFLIGVLFGVIVFGYITDRFGRKFTMILTAALCFAALLGCCFVHNFWLFVVCRLFAAVFGSGIFLSSFIYLLEITSSRWRTLVGVSFQLGFAIGYMILSGIAYYWNNWHDMQFVMAMFTLPFALFLFVIPESPRWLFSNGKNEQAKEITRKIAKYNKVELDEGTLWHEAEQSGDLKKVQENDNIKTYSSIDLFRSPKMRLITILLILNWFVNGLIYYGLSLNVGSLNGNIFVNNTLNGVMEIGSYIFIIALMDWTGRRIMLAFMLVFGGVTVLCATIVDQYAGNDQGLQTLSVVFAMAAKIGTSGSFAVIYNFTTELYPTVVRSNAVAMGSTGARIGSIISPFVISLQSYIPWLPNVIFGVLALLAAAMVVLLPETKNIDMFETLEDAELFYASRNVGSLNANQAIIDRKDMTKPQENESTGHRQSGEYDNPALDGTEL